jgi:hypothetical protein
MDDEGQNSLAVKIFEPPIDLTAVRMNARWVIKSPFSIDLAAYCDGIPDLSLSFASIARRRWKWIKARAGWR